MNAFSLIVGINLFKQPFWPPGSMMPLVWYGSVRGFISYSLISQDCIAVLLQGGVSLITLTPGFLEAPAGIRCRGSTY